MLSYRVPYLVLLLLLAFMTVTTVRGGGSVVVLTNQFIAPVLAIVLVWLAGQRGKGAVRFIALSAIAVGAIEATTGLLEYAASSYLFYVDFNAAEYAWYFPGVFDRPVGLTGHALVLGFACSAAIPLLVQVRRPMLQVGLAVLLTAGTLASQTRLSLAVAFIGLAYVVVRSHLPLIGRAIVVTSSVIGVVYLVAVAESIPAFQRMNLNDGSAKVRWVAYEWFIANWQSIPVDGVGIGRSYDVARSAGVMSSFESSIIQLIVDVGAPVALAFSMALIWLLLSRHKEQRLRGTLPAALLGIVLTTTFSSLSNMTLVGPLMFVLIGLGVAGLCEPTPVKGVLATSRSSFSEARTP
ncbi:hypothetical protein [Agromyces sp. NPDC049794]|uniref:hypothetical protein n=1 Tax=unclassified Agromyces TaxID=2639701 RepID=UPI0033E67CE3